MAKAAPKKKSNNGFLIIIAVVAIAGGTAIYSAVQGNKTKAIELNTSVPVAEGKGHLMGNPDAPFTIIEFGDFECPGCGQFATIQEPDLKKRIVDAGLANFKFFDFPLSGAGHQNTLAAHLAAACADEQGKFWEMHDALFAGQYDWNTLATSNPRKVIDGYAKQIGLDQQKYAECFDTQRALPQVQANKAEGDKLGVRGTPTIVIGNRMYNPTPNVDDLLRILDSLKTAGAGAAAAPADTTKK